MKKILNKEIICYLIAGVLTTLVNILAYYVFAKRLHIDPIISNGIAWFISVLFAFWANDRFVFPSPRGNYKEEGVKLAKFMSARIASFFIDESGMFLLVTIMEIPDLPVKVFMNGIVIVLNYILSKIFIFRK